MSTYEPGTVAVATVRGVPNVRVMAGHGTSEPILRWLTTDPRLVDSDNDGWYFDYQATDIRPLVVLDIPERVVQALVEYLRGVGDQKIAGDRLDLIADQIEAQTKPPKPAEPTGLGAVVEDAEGLRWVQARDPQDSDAWGRWRSWPVGMWKSYADIDAVRVLSVGVS